MSLHAQNEATFHPYVSQRSQKLVAAAAGAAAKDPAVWLQKVTGRPTGAPAGRVPAANDGRPGPPQGPHQTRGGRPRRRRRRRSPAQAQLPHSPVRVRTIARPDCTHGCRAAVEAAVGRDAWAELVTGCAGQEEDAAAAAGVQHADALGLTCVAKISSETCCGDDNTTQGGGGQSAGHSQDGGRPCGHRGGGAAHQGVYGAICRGRGQQGCAAPAHPSTLVCVLWCVILSVDTTICTGSSSRAWSRTPRHSRPLSSSSSPGGHCDMQMRICIHNLSIGSWSSVGGQRAPMSKTSSLSPRLTACWRCSHARKRRR